MSTHKKKKLPAALRKGNTSISIMAATCDRGRRAARTDSRSFSGYVEALIEADLERRGAK